MNNVATGVVRNHSHQNVNLTTYTKSEEEFIESVISLELVQCFSKLSQVRALKPITSAIESNTVDYQSHWRQLLLYEVYCKLTESTSEMSPSYPPIQSNVFSPPSTADKDVLEFGQGATLTLRYISDLRALCFEATVSICRSLNLNLCRMKPLCK